MEQLNSGLIGFNKLVKIIGYWLVFVIVSCVQSKKSNSTTYYQSSDLTEMPDSIFKNKKVKVLDFAPGWVMINGAFYDVQTSVNHRITVVPETICQLSKLEVLNLANNDVKNLPDCFYKLKNLKELDLSYNESFDIETFLSKVNQLKKLKKLNLFGIPAVAKDTNLVRSKINLKKISLLLTEHDLLNNIKLDGF